MPRKANGNGTTSRRTRAVASIETPAGQVVPEVRKNAKTVDLNEEIRRRAYEIYLERRGTAGDEHQDWLIAEREIGGRHQRQ
jgi:DNA-binding transcriptional regulator YhcF (GntR family)